MAIENEDIRERARQLLNNSIDNSSKEVATKYYKEQIALISEQKEFSKTIKRATVVTTIATVIMALAIIAQCIIMIMLYQR